MHDHRHWDSKNSHLPSQHNRGYACILMVQWILSSVLLTSNVFYGIIPHHLLDITNNIHSISKANKIQTVGMRRLLCFCLLKPNWYFRWKHSVRYTYYTFHKPCIVISAVSCHYANWDIPQRHHIYFWTIFWIKLLCHNEKVLMSHPVMSDPNNDKRKCSYESNG